MDITSKSKGTDSAFIHTKRKRLDLEMEIEGNDSAFLLSPDSANVTYPLLLVTGKLVADADAENTKEGFDFKESKTLKLDFDHGSGKNETRGDENGSSNQRKVKRLPLATSSALDYCNRTDDTPNKVAMNLDDENEERNVFRDPNLGTLLSNSASNHIILCHSQPMDHTMNWSVFENGMAKIFVPLKPGENTISLQNVHDKLTRHDIKVSYKPLENRRYVRPVYIICANSDGTFEAPPGEDNSVESAKQRIAFNARILQTFTAEHLFIHGFRRKTFRLEEDDDGNVKVNVFHSKLELNKALCMSGNELYEYFHEELNSSELFDPLCKFWTFMSCTRYMPPNSNECFNEKKIAEYVKGHTALGGGNMALFGTGCLHTWARSLEELVSRFTDDKKIDRRSLFDDSANRGYCWANYATTLGAAIHELGHTFNLPHTPSGIMGRGFDDMNYFFVCHRDIDRRPIEVAGSLIDIYKDGGAHWHRSSAAILSCSRWIGERRNDNTPAETVAPLMYNCANKRGPIGSGADASEKTVKFCTHEWRKADDLVLKGFRVWAKKYINALQFMGKQKSCANDSSDIILSQWFGNREKDGDTYEFLIDSTDERLISIDVRAGLWVDAIRFHSTHKSSDWIGGKGGDLYNLNFGDCIGFDNIFGTAGEEYVTSIGITQCSENDKETSDKNCYFYSPYGIRVVEVRQKNGEVMQHWEFLDGEPQQNVCMLQDELFVEKAETVAIYDGNGECGVYNINNFRSKF